MFVSESKQSIATRDIARDQGIVSTSVPLRASNPSSLFQDSAQSHRAIRVTVPGLAVSTAERKLDSSWLCKGSLPTDRVFRYQLQPGKTNRSAAPVSSGNCGRRVFLSSLPPMRLRGSSVVAWMYHHCKPSDTDISTRSVLKLANYTNPRLNCMTNVL